MLVGKDNYNDTTHVKFVSYTGKFPNLCRGILTLEIDDEIETFGHGGKYDSFQESGGWISSDYEAFIDEWEIHVDKLPIKFIQYASEIDAVFNTNVPYGCCGGCI